MFVEEPALRPAREPNEWVIVQEGRWRSPETEFVVPVGWITDLASVPKFLRPVLNRNGRSRYPAICHDWLYNTQKESRAFADRVFLHALIAYDMPAWQARIYWAGVRAGGWAPWRARLKRGGGLRPDDFVDQDAYRRAIGALKENGPIETGPSH